MGAQLLLTARRPASAAFPLLVALLAGCAGAPAPPTGPAEADQSRFAWTGCDGFNLQLIGPSFVYEGSVPEGWEDPMQPANRVQLSLYRCERVSWGPFERGPATVLLELHSVFSEPDACLGHGEAQGGAMLQSIWFSDAELAAYARDRHGMPAHAAEFGAANRSLGAGTEWEWAWTALDSKGSRVLLEESSGGLPKAMPDYTTRVFWSNGAGVSFMDLTMGYEHDEAATLLAHGVLQPPLLHGSMPVPDFATRRAARHWNEHADAAIAHFQDASCLEPA